MVNLLGKPSIKKIKIPPFKFLLKFKIFNEYLGTISSEYKRRAKTLQAVRWLLHYMKSAILISKQKD